MFTLNYNIKRKAFSLIEILVSLIIISLVVSAFVPIVTKKLKSSELTVGGFSTVTSDCDEYSVGEHKCLMCASGHCTLCSSQISIASGYYVDPEISCEPKKCSDKFGSACSTCNKHECTSCPNVAVGYYADPKEGCVSKACSTKFANCSACTKDTCLAYSCSAGYGYNSATHACTKCNAGYYSPGGTSSCKKCDAGKISSAGASTCTECKASEHKVANAAQTACENKYCGKGQYIENVTCKSCGSGTYQDSASHQSTTCKTCSASSHLVANATTGATGCTNKYCGTNQYIDGVTCKTCSTGTYQTSTSHQNTTCTSCPTGCSACTSATKCTACTGNYMLNSSNMCIQGCNPQTVTLSGTTTQVTRFNMGDDPQCSRDVLASLSGVTFVDKSTSCTGELCCWYGTTAKSTCTDMSGGIYSGCNRTVCKWWAAEKLCASIGAGWKLPDTAAAMKSWYPTNSTASTGLMLCDNTKSSTKASKCEGGATKICLGANENTCHPVGVWAASSNSNSRGCSKLNNGSWNTTTYSASTAFSVRCIKE